MSDDLTTLVRAPGIANESGNLTPGHSVDLIVNSQQDTGPLIVEGEQVAPQVREQGSHREVVSITESMGDFLEWSVGDRDFWAPIGSDVENLTMSRTGEPPTDDATADSVDSAPHRGTAGGPANTMENEQEVYENVPRNENGAPIEEPGPEAYRTVSESTLSNQQLAALAGGIVLALVVGRRAV